MHPQHLIQLRRVPDRVYRELRSRAALEGLSLQAYVLRELERVVERPTMREVLDRVAERGPLARREDVAALLAEEREERDRDQLLVHDR